VSVKYTVTKESIENSLDFFEFSEYEKFLTTRNEDGKETYKGLASGYSIKNGEVSIPKEEYSLWEDTVFNYINSHNDGIVENIEKTIEFKILDIDSNACCKYEEYISGKLVKVSTGWCKDLRTKAEKDAWRKAVKAYKKNNGLPTSTSKFNNHIATIKEKVDALDQGLGVMFDLTPPLIEAALVKLATDPCNFVSEVVKAVKIAISRINGVPSPIELANYYVKLLKDNIETTVENKINATQGLVKLVVNPCLDEMESITPYFDQLDSEYEEFMKTHSSDVALYYQTIDEEIQVTPYTYGYGEGEETSYNNININSLGNFEYTGGTNHTLTTYKELEPNLIAKGGMLRASRPNTNIPQSIYRNINEALKNCWIPLRIAWEQYCKQRGWNPTWNITSGYRPDSKGSAHQKGWAIDVQPHYNGNEDKRQKAIALGNFIYNYCKSNRNIKVDQLLVEYESRYSIWVHIGYKRPSSGEQRGQYYADYNAKGSHGTCKII
jgi:hypothetical protein